MASDRERRDRVSALRLEAGRRMQFFQLGGSSADPNSLINADGLRWRTLDRYGLDDHPNLAEIARDLGLNDEFTRLILIGKREPSKAFLDAIGYERVMVYRRRVDR